MASHYTTTMTNLYTKLRDNSSLTAKIPSSNIYVGWKNDETSYPSLSLIQAAGNAVGQLGCSVNSTSNVRGTFAVQMNIYSQSSVLQTYQIYDELSKIMISSGYALETNVDTWDDIKNSHLKITRWRKTDYYEE